MEGTVRTKSGFTLLEVLIAVGVLFIIGSAVLSLSNTLIQGTVGTADATVTNLWAAEGLELASKNRDDRVKDDVTQPWLDQAVSYANYGWYRIALQGNTVVLTRADFNGNSTKLRISKAEAMTAGDQLVSESLTASRLICIEAVGADSNNQNLTGDQLGCNLNPQGNASFNDGARQISTACRPNDLYCAMTKDSLNRNNSRDILTPAGSAVKVRAVLVWQNQFGYQTTQMGTMLTNWRSADL
jgi:prepilin-type N-terminal cleavage/methylation domain-containing protein